MTGGVIQPAHTLSRGKFARSTIRTSSPECCSAHAQEDPAGPPPTISTSQWSIAVIQLAFHLDKDRVDCMALRGSCFEGGGSGIAEDFRLGRRLRSPQDRAATSARMTFRNGS